MEENIEIEEDVNVVEDFYESIGTGIGVSYNNNNISSFNQNNVKFHNIENAISKIKHSNEIKMNKLKLLLYQKFLNILFSTFSLNLRKDFRTFNENVKYLRIKSLGYKLKNDQKFKCPDFYMKNLMKQIDRKEKKEKIQEL
jgi:hypothetical protein